MQATNVDDEAGPAAPVPPRRAARGVGWVVGFGLAALALGVLGFVIGRSVDPDLPVAQRARLFKVTPSCELVTRGQGAGIERVRQARLDIAWQSAWQPDQFGDHHNVSIGVLWPRDWAYSPDSHPFQNGWGSPSAGTRVGDAALQWAQPILDELRVRYTGIIDPVNPPGGPLRVFEELSSRSSRQWSLLFTHIGEQKGKISDEFRLAFFDTDGSTIEKPATVSCGAK